MDDALLGADRAVADDDGFEIGSDTKAHAPTVTAAFVRSELIHCRLGPTNRTATARVAVRLTGCPLSSLVRRQGPRIIPVENSEGGPRWFGWLTAPINVGLTTEVGRQI